MATPPKILVVDDEADTLGLVELTLQTAGYTVKTAASGGEALLLGQQEPFDAILLDIMMPDISGFEVYKRLHSTLKPMPPVVFFTAKSHPEDRETGEGLGAQAFLVKPVTRGQLLDTLHKALDRNPKPRAPS